MRVITTACLSLLALSACSNTETEIREDLRCLTGAYRMANGAVFDVGLSGENSLRWRTLDGQNGHVTQTDDGVWSGTTGWSDRPNPARIVLGECGDNVIEIVGIAGHDGTGERIPLQVEDMRFQGEGETLAGRLVLPEGEAPVPIVVLVHGSEDWSARDYDFQQRTLPAQGIGVFVYDKRGTGGSTGTYSQDFDLLAADAAAAHRTALEHAGERVAYSGYFGGSQGGWVAPLAATLSDVDFVIASFGMAEGPLAEDRDEVQLRLRDAGFGAEEQAKAREITDITARLLLSDFQDGASDLARVRREYQNEAWFPLLEGGISYEMVKRPLWQFRIGFAFLDTGTSWDYVPVDVMRTLETPMLWVIAGSDRSTPPENTLRILAELQAEDRAIDVALFPGTDHGIVRFEEDEDGERTILGYAPGYFPLLSDWIIQQELGAAYPGAELAPRRPSESDPG
ncbi:alpha/beta hydrolase family protein [Maricaulis sp. D1M11]|uniref:alpha/beta hydrolase family protein n=1 Tax=Maricaulis sp. D1M11 TaxID=3076117 RepID=UPI0039B63609